MSGILQALIGGAGRATSAGAFKVNLRTGTGATASITGVPFAPDLYIGKGRSGATAWGWYDSSRGATFDLDSTSNAAQTTQATGITSFDSGGVTMGALAKLNTNTATYLDLLFKKSTKFLDVVSYSGNGFGFQTISHALGAVPGMIVIKRTDNTSDFAVWHIQAGTSATARAWALNSTAAAGSTSYNATTSVTSTTFDAGAIWDGSSTGMNVSGASYIAYVFGHDTSASSVSYCGTFTTDGSGNATVSGLPFQPQFLMFKMSAAISDWFLLDTTRGWSAGNDPYLAVNTSLSENGSAGAGDYGAPASTGFTFASAGRGAFASQSFIYWAIK